MTATLTHEERETLRALAFHRFDMWHDETLKRVAAVEGWLVEVGRSYAGRHFAGTETYCRTIDQRAADARAIARTPIRGDWARRKYVARSIRSRGRFLAWYVPAMNARRAEQHRHIVSPEVDIWRALAAAELVDIDVSDVETATFAMTLRDAVPSWEPRDVKPYRVAAVKPFLGSSIRPYGRLEAYEYRSPYVPRSMVPEGVYLESTADPMQYNAGNMFLEIEAQAFLGEHGEKLPLPDRYKKGLFRWEVKPDRAAYRGKVRFERHAPMRYQRSLKRAAVGDLGQIELETRLAPSYACSCGPLRTIEVGYRHPVKVPTPLVWRGRFITRGANPDSNACICTRRGWIGHRAVTFAKPARVERAEKAVPKKAREMVGAGSRGPAITPWLLSERSLPTASERVRESWEVIEQVIRTNVDGSDIEMSDGTVITVIGSAQVFDHHRGRAYPVREWCRRYALQHAADSVA